MRMKSLLMLVAGIVLAIANVQSVVAQEAKSHINQTSVIPINGISEGTDGNYNFKSFEINASKAGYYYVEFWLLPARYSNNCYTTFIVFVNNDFVGTINPSVGNWQAARVDGKQTIELEKGVNVITIATLAPEFPEVETVKVALEDSEAVFSSDAYEKYLKEVVSGVSCDIQRNGDVPTYASDATTEDLVKYSNVPLNYTFYKIFSFTKGQEIFIISSSLSQHKMDVVFYGSPPELFGPNRVKQATQTSLGTVGQGTFVPYLKDTILYTPATSEEMQGLSYVYPSEKTLNSSIQVATAKMTVPKTGLYLVRVRHVVNGASSVADVNVNGVYYYENAPITLSYVDCQIPADGNAYATMTCGYNFGTDDPCLFIHGANSDRVVGYNDDVSYLKAKQLNLSVWDSYISQIYFMKTSGISVSNYSSSNPKSQCSIIVRKSEDVVRAKAEMSTNMFDSVYMPTLLKSAEYVKIVGPGNVNGIISISANDKIHRLSLYGLDGKCIGFVKVENCTAMIPASVFNIRRSGIYIINIETANGIISKKIVVK